MKRLFSVIGLLLLVVGLLPVQNVVAQNTNNFRITSYDIQYELARDSERRSTLKTTETIVAEFPDFDQNHGLERAISSTYDGHPTDVNITKVTDTSGKERQHTTYSSNGNTVLRIGNADTYVHGLQSYRIEYIQRDVTRFFEDNGRDEWYWDTNGTEWKVPIDALTVSMKIDPAIVETREGEAACYQGAARVTTACKIIVAEDGSYGVTATNLAMGENVTIAFGFKAGTFAHYEESFFTWFALLWGIVQIASFPIGMVIVAIFGLLLMRRRYRMSEQDPIVAEYIPPKDASVVVVAQTILTKQYVFTAYLIDLAVRHFISIIETQEKSLWRSAKYDIAILKDLQELREEEKEIISDMFGHLPNPGERLALDTLKGNMAYSIRTMDNDKKLKTLLNDIYGIKEKSSKDSKFFYRWAIGFLVLAIVSLSVVFLVVALFLFLYGYFLRPLSDKGLALRRYVLGLDKYIKASEAERLAFLQGPETAQKIGYDIDPNNPGQIVKLYERVLPYAILFGREKEWSKRLGEFYEQSGVQPDWYVGTHAFTATAFASTIQGITHASNYSSASSSSSGGSSGGGFSGGGGGGGGGGGW